jgi:cytochrome c556
MNKPAIIISFFITAAAISVLAWGQQSSDDESAKERIFYELQTIEEDPVAYRRLVKQALENHMAAYGLILIAKSPHSDHGQAHADALVALAEQNRVLYPAGSETAGTQPEIWSQPEAFVAALEKTSASAALLKEKHEEGNRHLVLNALTRLGESCEGCHSRFRAGAN